jgi:hypothetical protein
MDDDVAHRWLTRLGLGKDADARAIRRSYARELKRIDQLHDAAGFQALREAYEGALQWTEYKSYRVTGESAADASSEAPYTQFEESVTDEEAPMPDFGAPLTEQQKHLSRTQFIFAPGRDAHGALQLDDAPAIAGAAFDAFFRTLPLATLGEEDGVDQCEAALRTQFENPAMLTIAARTLFERGIAELLADGWKPGHQILFAAATNFFGWDADRSRLHYLGYAGAMLNAAIDQQALFGRQFDSAIVAQRKVLARLRNGDSKPVQVKRDMVTVEGMCRHFPIWMALMVDSGTIGNWRWIYQVSGGPPISIADIEKAPAFREEQSEPANPLLQALPVMLLVAYQLWRFFSH